MRTPDSQPHSPFRPTLAGCVTRDLALARALEGLYLHALYSVAATTYRSLIAERHDRALAATLDEISIDQSEHFRLLGDLILALGGNPTVRTEMQVEPIPALATDGRHAEEIAARLISRTFAERKWSIDRMQTLMGSTQDRIVRSILVHLITDEERHLQMLRNCRPQ